MQVVDSGFKTDATAAARQYKVDPRNVRKHVQKLKEKMREEASPGPQGSRILADLLSGKIQVAAGKKTPAPKKRRVQSTPVTGLRIARQVPRPAPGSRKRKADGPLAKKASFKRQPAMVQKDYKDNAEEYKKYKEAYKLATDLFFLELQERGKRGADAGIVSAQSVSEVVLTRTGVEIPERLIRRHSN